VDAQLHLERIDPRTRARRLHEAALEELPDGAFVLLEREPWLVLGDALLRWTPGGYTERATRVSADGAPLLTPPSLVAILQAGWRSTVPVLHPTTR
jgi:hypothetical protein